MARATGTVGLRSTVIQVLLGAQIRYKPAEAWIMLTRRDRWSRPESCILLSRKLGVQIQAGKVMNTMWRDSFSANCPFVSSTAFTREIGVSGLPAQLVPAATLLYKQSQNWTLQLIANGWPCFFESFRTKTEALFASCLLKE